MKRGTSKNPRFRLRKSRGRREEPRSGRMTATPTNRRASDSKRETFWKLTRKCFAIEKKRSSDTQEAGRHTRGGFKKRGGRDTKEAEKKRSQGDGRKIAELRVSKLKFVVQGSQERRRDEQQCDEEERRGNTRKRGNSSLLSAGCDRTGLQNRFSCRSATRQAPISPKSCLGPRVESHRRNGVSEHPRRPAPQTVDVVHALLLCGHYNDG
jgi:hypothetical protein